MGLFDLFRKQGPARPSPLGITTKPDLVYAPANGRVEPMESLPDPVFASGAMGTALGVWPEEGVVYAPISGAVTVAMPHALGIVNDEVELLVHVGVDTVEMNGDGFSVQVEKGQRVSAGDALLVFDRAKVADAGHPDAVMAIVTNTAEVEAAGGRVEPVASGSVSAGEPFLRVRR